jgi:NADH dehydrogenase
MHSSRPTKIVILGGGFGGLEVARHLDRLFRHDEDVEIILVNSDNYFQFNPMLPEVAGSAIEAKHVVSPLRAFFRKVAFHEADVEGIDLAARRVTVAHGVTRHAHELPFDHLVLALGSVTNFRGLPGVAENALTFKSLGDAMVLRNRMIDLFEQADLECCAEERRPLMTFIVAGAGFSGVELAAALWDFCHAAGRFYRNIRPDETRLLIVHPGERILPELGPELADYALKKLRTRGVEVRLKTGIRAAGRGWVETSSGERIPAHTLVWTAGIAPNPLLQHIPCQKDRRGAVIVNPYLEVPDCPGVWALGDCALVADPDTGHAYPPTAQHAIREAKALAANLATAIRGGLKRPFRFRTLGTFVSLGHRSAVAEVRGLRFSGFLAWWLWRTVYLAKLPRLERKVRVALDWTLDLFFPRDFAQLRPFQGRAVSLPTLEESTTPAAAPPLSTRA